MCLKLPGLTNRPGSGEPKSGKGEVLRYQKLKRRRMVEHENIHWPLAKQDSAAVLWSYLQKIAKGVVLGGRDL